MQALRNYFPIINLGNGWYFIYSKL
jgi:hypothetical protein